MAALLARLMCIFQEDPLIDEVGLLFGIEARDLTPETAFTLENHKLGVAFAAGKPLFQAARLQFHVLNARFQEKVTEITQSNDNEQRAQLVHCTRAILLISADFYTAWNTRKLFVTRGWLNAHDEIQFTNLVFTLHPKSIDTWAYRRWLANLVCQSSSENDNLIFYSREIEVCSRLAEQKPRNYHAWSFRHWIVSQLPVVLTLQELKDMERWCRTHITDHSGWNHRQHTLNELIKKYRISGHENLSKELILTEYKFVSEIVTLYPSHEALWCHRRYVMQRLLDELPRTETAICHDLTVLHKSISLVSMVISRSTPESYENTTLDASLDQQLKHLSSNSDAFVLCAVVNEIGIAWKCGNQFSRRFSAWCLARLRVFLYRHQKVEEIDTSSLDSLTSIVQKSLVQDDSMLKDLWVGAFAECE
ncbi:putative protein prenyltransferase, alpha subunit [Plasmopara halstedii]